MKVLTVMEIHERGKTHMARFAKRSKEAEQEQRDRDKR